MSDKARYDVQLGIEFLVDLDLTGMQHGALPDVPDYSALAREAEKNGFAVSPAALQEAFRLLMQARMLGPRQSPRGLARSLDRVECDDRSARFTTATTSCSS